MNLILLTERDVFEIAFITTRGWTLNLDGTWTKQGTKKRCLATDGTYNEIETYTRDEAFWHEQP